MENKLDPEFKKRWIEALRSGEYKQGRDLLYYREDDSFCCLGVAGIICGVSQEDMHGATQFGTSIPEYEIPKPPQLPAFLSHDNDQQDEILETIVAMNDGGTPFSEIADWIEANL